jgi:transcriptional regulator with XRE-family HTH domain
MGTRAVELGDVGRAVAHNVKVLREARGLTQTDVSDRMRTIGRPLLPTGVLKVEQGIRRVDVDDLVALALVFDVPPDELLGPLAEGGRTGLQRIERVERALAALRDVQAMLAQVAQVALVADSAIGIDAITVDKNPA